MILMKRKRRKERKPEAIKSIIITTEQAEKLGADFGIISLETSDRILKMYTSGEFEVKMEFFEEYILYTLIEKESGEKFSPIGYIKTDYTAYFNPFSEVITFSEAQDLWGLGSSTLRKAVSDKRFFPEEIRKSGNTWLVTKTAMERLYGRRNHD